MTIPTHRPLTIDEVTLLRWILEHGSEEAKAYLPQIDGMLARSSCSCGCPSISLVVSEDTPAASTARDRIVADLSGQTPEGITVGILLFQDNGRLSELEIYPYDNEDPFSLPKIESLPPFEEGKPIE